VVSTAIDSKGSSWCSSDRTPHRGQHSQLVWLLHGCARQPRKPAACSAPGSTRAHRRRLRSAKGALASCKSCFRHCLHHKSEPFVVHPAETAHKQQTVDSSSFMYSCPASALLTANCCYETYMQSHGHQLAGAQATAARWLHTGAGVGVLLLVGGRACAFSPQPYSAAFSRRRQ
jgi:hypothetical protein